MTPAPGTPVVGLVGCGNWGKHILRDLVALGCDVAVVARSPESRGNAEAGGAVLVCEAVEALPNVDAAVVATPTAVREPIIMELLGRGVPVFTEKPLAADVATAERLVAAADDRLFVMEKWRYHPGIMELAEIAQSGEFGPVLGLHARRVNWGIDHPDVDPVWTLIPHDLSIIDEILGYIPEPVWARGEILSGRPGSLIGALGDAPWVVIEVSATNSLRRREIRLMCRDATVILEDAADHLVFIASHADLAPTTTQRPVGSELPLFAELEAFIDHVRGADSSLLVPASRSVGNVRAAQRLRELAGFGVV